MAASSAFACALNPGRRSDGHRKAGWSILFLFLVVGAAPDVGTSQVQTPPAPSAPRKLVIVDRSGHHTMIGEVPANTWGPRVSRDGRWLALTLTGDTRAGDVLYVAPLMNPGALRRLGPGRNPHWSHDGTRLFFSGANTETLLWRGVDSDDAGEQLLTPVRAPESLSADGRILSYVQALDERFSGWTLDLVTRTRTPIPDSGPESLGTNISPDGRWIAYQSTRSGRHEAWVQPLGRPGPAVQVTVQGGYRPLWSADMREMYFDDGNRRLFAVPIRTEPAFAVAGPAVPLPIEGFVQTGVGRRMYDLLPDGRFLMIFP
jgi:serine/threonine-protein kinase